MKANNGSHPVRPSRSPRHARRSVFVECVCLLFCFSCLAALCLLYESTFSFGENCLGECAGLLYIPSATACIPNAILLDSQELPTKDGSGKEECANPILYPKVNCVCWGIILLGQGFVKTYASFVVLRFFQGLFEASILPTLMTMCSIWWTREEQSLRSAFW